VSGAERLLIVLIVGFFATLPIANLLTIDLGFPLTIAHLFAAAIAVTLLWQDRLRPRIVTWLPASLLAAFCIVYAISFALNLGSDLPHYSWATGRNAPEIRSVTKVLWLIGNVAIALVIANAVRRTSSERVAIRALAIGAVGAALYGLYQVIGGTYGFFVPLLPGSGSIIGQPSHWIVLRAKGMFLEPNFFGSYLAAALPFVAVGWINFRNQKVTGGRTAAVMLPLTVAGVIVTFAIGGWLPAGLAGLVLLTLSGLVGARALLVRLGTAGIVATLAMAILIPNFPRAASALVYKGALSTGAATTDDTGPTPAPGPTGRGPGQSPGASPTPSPEETLRPEDAQISVEERAALSQAALSMFRSSPIIGVGPGNFGFRYDQFRPAGAPEPTQLFIATNIYAELLAESGILGFATFLIGFLGLAGLAVLAAFRARGLERLELAAGVAAMAALAIAFVASPTFTLLYQWAILGLVGALIVRGQEKRPAEPQTESVAGDTAAS
jgi:O-antigen ligase